MKRRSRRIAIGLLGVAAVLAVLSIVVLRVVSPSRWPADAIFVPRDVPTLQEAFSQATTGMTIVLQAQEEAFTGPVTIDVADVTLTSTAGRATVMGEGSQPALTLRADGISLYNLDISAESVGLQVESSQCRVQNIVVRDTQIGMQLLRAKSCSLEDLQIQGSRIGLRLVSSSGNRLDGLVIDEATESGVQVVSSVNNSFIGIVVTDTPIGISLEQGSTENEFSGCRIEGSSLVGVEIHGSNDTTLRDSVVTDCAIGVALKAVTGSEIANCSIQRCVDTAVSLRQAVQNRILENTIEAAGDAGIRLSQSAENALSYNRIARSTGAAIHLERSDRNLIMGNVLTENGFGIHAERSSYTRVLRNSVSASELAGLLFESGHENRFLDNQIIGGMFGIVLAESGRNTLVRNQVEDQQVSGLSVVAEAYENSVAENRIGKSSVGILIADSPRGRMLDNHLSRSDIGLLLFQPGSGLRIEGNTIQRNGIGLKQDDTAADMKAAYGLLGIDLGEGVTQEASPVIVNNVFSRNELLDISNESSAPLYAAGNWWGGLKGIDSTDVAKVSEGVYLEESVGKGAIAIGTETGLPQVLLGRILQLALTATGFRVVDLVGMGDSRRVLQALRAGDVDLVAGRANTSLDEILGGESDLEIIPIDAERGWVAVASGALTERLAEPTISALSLLASEEEGTLRYAVPRSFTKEAFASFVETYGMQETVGSVNWTQTLGEAETLLRLGAADVAVVGNLEEVLTFSGFVTLEDDLRAFGSTALAVVVRRSLRTQFPEVEDTLSHLRLRLTTAAIHDLISRVRLLHLGPEDVASEFLLQSGLVAD